MMQTRIMIVAEEKIVCERLERHLAGNGYSVDGFTDRDLALRALEDERYHVVVTDLRFADPSTLDVLQQVRRTQRSTQVIIITECAALEDAQDGVYVCTFLSKPFALKELTDLVSEVSKRAVEGGFALPPGMP